MSHSEILGPLLRACHVVGHDLSNVRRGLEGLAARPFPADPQEYALRMSDIRHYASQLEHRLEVLATAADIAFDALKGLEGSPAPDA